MIKPALAGERICRPLKRAPVVFLLTDPPGSRPGLHSAASEAGSINCLKRSCSAAIQSIPYRQPIAPSRISRAQTHARFFFDHDPFGIADIARLCEFVAAGEQSVL